jgi:hypothetical protein
LVTRPSPKEPVDVHGLAEVLAAHLKLEKDEVADAIVRYCDVLGIPTVLRDYSRSGRERGHERCKTIEGLAFLASQAAREARQDPLLASLTHGFEKRPLTIVEFAKTEDRIEERLALMESTAKWVTRLGPV